MRILMFFHAGSLNRGCEAIVRSGVDLIKKIDPNAIVNLVSFNPDSDQLIPNIDTVFDGRDLDVKRISFTGFTAALQNKFFKDETPFLRAKHHNIIKHIPNHDVFLSIGGDNYCYGEQQWLYEIDRLIKKAGKKLILWGASIGNEDLSPAKIKDLSSFDLLLVRESLTYKILKDSGLNKVKLIADGAFTMKKEEVLEPEGWQSGNTIGFNFSPLVWKRNKDSKKAAFDLIDHILETTNMTIALTPHVIMPGNDDSEVLKEFYQKYKSTNRVLLVPDNLNAVQYKGYISKMRFFIGARTHATIAAYSSCVPTMVLGYSVKSKGIAIDIFGTEKLVLNIHEISDSKKLISKFNEMLIEEKEIVNTLANKIPEIKANAHKAATYLFEVIQSNN